MHSTGHSYCNYTGDDAIHKQNEYVNGLKSIKGLKPEKGYPASKMITINPDTYYSTMELVPTLPTTLNTHGVTAMTIFQHKSHMEPS